MADHDHNLFPSDTDRRLRMVREPLFSPLDAAAAAVIFVMVCMPLALGAFGW